MELNMDKIYEENIKVTRGFYSSCLHTTARKSSSNNRGSYPPAIGSKKNYWECIDIIKYQYYERWNDHTDIESYKWIAIWKSLPKPKRIRRTKNGRKLLSLSDGKLSLIQVEVKRPRRTEYDSKGTTDSNTI